MQSLFVVILRYLTPLEQIDAHRPEHFTFLEKHYANGDFIVSGTQVPRSGGIIFAHAKSRSALEATLKEDPFHKHHLAEYQIFEFNPTKSSDKFKEILNQYS